MFNPKIKNIFAFSLIGLLFLAVLFFIGNAADREKESYHNLFTRAQVFSLTKAEKETVTLMFVGDIMLNRGVEYSVKNNGQGDFKWPFLKVADFLNKADVLFGNLESVISDKGMKVGSIYSFRAETEAIKGLSYAGFDIVSVANNHIFDYGREAMEDSFSRLKQAKIDYVGGGFSEEEARSSIIKEVGETKIAYLAYVNLGSVYWAAKGEKSGIAWLDKRISDDIRAVEEKADLIVVSMHFGGEYRTSQNSEQEYFSHLAIDSGADLVIGHHPHVAQPIEEYGNGYIAYSLGNFIFDQKFSEETMRGMLLKVLVEDGKVKEVIPKNIKINSLFQPEIEVFVERD